MNKESVYDNEVKPLMVKIIQICIEHGIAFIANFELGNVDVITNIGNETGNAPTRHVVAAMILQGLVEFSHPGDDSHEPLSSSQKLM